MFFTGGGTSDYRLRGGGAATPTAGSRGTPMDDFVAKFEKKNRSQKLQDMAKGRNGAFPWFVFHRIKESVVIAVEGIADLVWKRDSHKLH